MRDYAHKQGLNEKRPTLKKHTRQEAAPAWGWTILGIALGLGIAVLVAIKLFPKLVGIDRSLATPGELEQDENSAAKIAPLHAAKTAEPKTPPKPKFDFYTLLPNMEETDIKEAQLIEEQQTVVASTVQAPKAEQLAVLEKTIEPKIERKTELSANLPHHTKPETFILQAAVFQSKQPAESLKAQLTLQGFEVKVEAYQKNESSTTWYRVYLGPYQQESQAKMAQISLQQTAHIDSFVIKTKA